MRVLRKLAKEQRWVHIGLGIVGNISFVIGSIFFLFDDLKKAGTWLFIMGSTGMLIGTLGDALVKRNSSD
jgi:hypothetical protein